MNKVKIFFKSKSNEELGMYFSFVLFMLFFIIGLIERI